MQDVVLTNQRRDVTKMLWTLVSGLVLLVVGQTATSVSLEWDTANCRVSADPKYGGNLTDCSDWDLSNVSRLHGLAQNTTTLVLDRTNIRRLHKNYFRHSSLGSLRYLSIRASNLVAIEVDALSGLPTLQILDLEYNSLPFCNTTAFPAGMFHHVPNLSHLLIGFNILYTDVSSNCQTYENIDIFTSLPHLTNLSIDAVSGSLDIGEQFSSLTHLTNLTVVCNKVTYISNSSLRALRRLPLEVLNLVALNRADVPLEAGVFQDLPSVQFLSMAGLHVSNHGILRAMQPFANRTMEAIKLVRTNKFQTFNTPSTTFNDGIIDEHARFLSSVCVRHFSWVDSLLFALKPNVLTRGSWRTCLQTLDLSQNKLENTGWLSVIFELTRLKNMREITISSIRSQPSDRIPKLTHFRLPDITNMRDGVGVRGQRETVDNNGVRGQRETVNNNKLTSTKNRSGLFYSRIQKFSHLAQTPHQGTMSSRGGNTDHVPVTITSRGDNTDHLPETMTSRGGNIDNFPETMTSRRRHENLLSGPMTSRRGLSDLLSEIMTSIGGRSDSFKEGEAARQTAPDDFHFHFPYNGNITIYLPASLERMKVIDIIFAGITLEYWKVVVASGSRLKQLYWTNNDLLRVQGAIHGLDTLQVLGFSGSTLDIANHILDNFLGLEILLLDNIKPDTFFHTNSLPRLLRNLTRLRYLDVSNNRLNSRLFPSDTFSSTPNISHVILSQNRFSNIPFDLETTPNLRVLDLSSNAILFLTDHEMLALDRHVSRVGDFLLRLEDNAIACVCSQIRFIVWMFTTHVTIQQTTPFPCLAEDGTSVDVRDLECLTTFARICGGKFFLMAALILTSLVIIAFLSAYLVTRFRTAIAAFLGKLLTRPAGPGDYQFDVFVGYADGDHRFAINVLTKYLEDGCQLVTYLPDRDLGPGYRLQLLDQAMHNSWRVLLVLSRAFLHDFDISEILMKLACHSVTAMNRKRLFVLVEKGQVHAVPCDLYDVLDETRIILFEDFHHQLDYQQQQRIKYCLR